MADHEPFTCAGCGLLCDDVTLEPSGDGVRLRPRCELGSEWFSARLRAPARNAPAATIAGHPADLPAALARAGELLRGARRPLLHGFHWATVQDARAAVALADRLGALVVTDGADAGRSGVAAVPSRGACTATLGEIRDRSQLVVIWREDPEVTHPRLLERLGFGGKSPSRLAAPRTLVVVADPDTATARRADVRLRWPPERDLEALTRLHAFQRGLEVRESDLDRELAGLLERMRAVPHAAVIHGAGLSAGAGGQRRALALHELVRALSHERHVVTLRLAAAAGVTGADDVLAWQTGYPGEVDLASGHPELVTATQSLSSFEGVDVAVSVEAARDALPDTVTEIALCSLPVDGVEVSVRTAAAGVGATGVAHRLDGVPLALQAPAPDAAPTAAALLGRLLAEVCKP